MRAMEKLVTEGLVRFIGVSNFDVEELKEAERALKNERMTCDQVLYHLGDRGIERRPLPYCTQRGIAVVDMHHSGTGVFHRHRVLEDEYWLGLLNDTIALPDRWYLIF
jgi:diketogulonate reductase-like aldo/keto reductase